MSKISLEPNASGAGTFSIVSPDSNTNRTLNLPDESGTIFSDGTGVPGPSVIGQLASSNMPAGSVIQVVNTVQDTSFTSANTEEFTFSGVSGTIAPLSSNSDILILVKLGGRWRNPRDSKLEAGYRVRRGSTSIYETNLFAESFSFTGANEFATIVGHIPTLVDNPNTTDSVTYDVDVGVFFGQFDLNDMGAESSITLMEIAG